MKTLKRIVCLLVLFLMLTVAQAQNLGNPQTIGQTNRNQKVGKGFQVEDTLLAKGKVLFSNLPVATDADTVVLVQNASTKKIAKVNKSTFLSGISGGGGNALFPKDLVPVTESRDFQASDAGKILILSDANLTMPAGSILQDGELIIVGVVNSETSIIEKAPGDTLNIYSPNDGSGNQELLLLEAINIDGQTILLPISTSVVDDNGVNKTAIRYLMDKSGGSYIPLSGTVDGSPVTGDIETTMGYRIYAKGLDSGSYSSISFDDLYASIYVIDGYTGYNTTFNVQGAEAVCNSTYPTSRGIISTHDYTPNITDLDYTQKKYVDTHIAFTTVPTSSTDIGIKGQMAVDASYLYICVDTDTWTRIALTW